MPVRLDPQPSLTFARMSYQPVTGGLLRVLKPLSPGAAVELMFSSHIGPVLAMAELLSPCSAAPIGLQPFRFIAIDKAELRKLRAAIASSQKMEAHLRPLGCVVSKPEMW